MNQPMGEEDGAELGDLLVDDDTPDVFDLAAESSAREALGKVLGQLGYRDRRVLEMRFGLGGTAPQTLDDVAGHFKVTRERVRQIEARSSLRALHEHADVLVDRRAARRHRSPTRPGASRRPGRVVSTANPEHERRATMATTQNTAAAPTSTLRDFLPDEFTGVRADDPLKVGFYAALLPAGAELKLITHSAVIGAQVELRRHPRRRQPHTVVITVDEHGAVEGMMTFIGDDGWQHTLRTAERTLRHLAANVDRDLLGRLRDKADPYTALSEEIDDLDDEVPTRSARSPTATTTAASWPTPTPPRRCARR